MSVKKRTLPYFVVNFSPLIKFIIMLYTRESSLEWWVAKGKRRGGMEVGKDCEGSINTS